MNKIKLSLALEKTGLKKKEIAKRLGFAPTYYSKFINKTKKRTPSQIEEILKMTGLNFEDVDWNC